MKRPEELRKGKERFINQQSRYLAKKFIDLLEETVEYVGKTSESELRFYEIDKVLVDKEKEDRIFEKTKEMHNKYPQLAEKIIENVDEAVDNWLKDFGWSRKTDKSGKLSWLEPIDVPETETAEESTPK